MDTMHTKDSLASYLAGLGNQWQAMRDTIKPAVTILEQLGDRHLLGIALSLTAASLMV